MLFVFLPKLQKRFTCDRFFAIYERQNYQAEIDQAQAWTIEALYVFLKRLSSKNAAPKFLQSGWLRQFVWYVQYIITCKTAPLVLNTEEKIKVQKTEKKFCF